MQHLELAADALQAFMNYARTIESLPNETDILVLRLHSDGSGRICSAQSSHLAYLQFNDLADLLEQLRVLIYW